MRTGTRTGTFSGGLGAGEESWNAPSPHPHPAAGSSKISVGSRANSSSVRDKGSLRGARLLPKSPEPPSALPTHPPQCPGRRGRGGTAGTRCWPWPALGSVSPLSCSQNRDCGCTPIPPHPQYSHRDPSIPVHGADGGGKLLLQPHQESLDQLVDAGLLPVLWEPTGAGLGGPVPAMGTQNMGPPPRDPPTLVKRGGTVTVGTPKKKL